MSRDDDTLNWIYDRTDGACHICWKKLSFHNYAKFSLRGAWEIEHSVPRSLGGSDHLNNLFAACISCNRSKRAGSTRSCRNRNGVQRAPFSRAKKNRSRRDNRLKGGILGGLLGSLGGSAGAAVGAIIGQEIGRSLSPKY